MATPTESNTSPSKSDEKTTLRAENEALKARVKRLRLGTGSLRIQQRRKEHFLQRKLFAQARLYGKKVEQLRKRIRILVRQLDAQDRSTSQRYLQSQDYLPYEDDDRRE